MKKYELVVRSLAAAILVGTAVSASAAPPGQDAPKNVQTARVQQGGVVQPLRLSGTAEPMIESTIPAEQQGVIEVMMVDEGDYVTTGTVLVALRRDPLRFESEAAAATMRAEKARLDELKAGSRAEDVLIARTAFDEAKVAYDIANRDLTRFKELFTSRSVSESELDRAKQTFESAKATLESAKARLELQEIGPRVEEIAAQEARFASATATAALQEDKYTRAEIRAPYSGVVSNRRVNVGSWVSEGDPILDLQAIDRLRIRAQVPEQEFNSVAPGTTAFVSFDANPNEAFEATVSRVIARANTDTRSFPILINVANPARSFAPGMLARVEFKRDMGGTTKVISKDALVAQGPMPVVFKVDYLDGVPFAKRLEVVTGRFFGEAVEVISEDLSPGDQVVTRGNERLQDGDKLALNVFVTNPAAYVAEQSKFFTEK